MSYPVLLGNRSGPDDGPTYTPPRYTKLRFALRRPGGATRLSLDEGGITVLAGADGLGDHGSEVLEQRSPGIFGSFVDPLAPVDVAPRDVFLPLALHGDGLEGLSDLKSQIRAVSNALAGMTRLEVALGSRPLRWMDGYRVDKDPAWDRDTFGVQGRQKVGLLLRCPDPWARSAPIVRVWALGDVYGWFPIFPLQLSDSEVLGSDNPVTMTGDVPSYPRWDINGPLTAVTATNTTSGRSWQLDRSLASGEVMAIGTDPRDTYVTVTSGGVTSSAWSSLQPPFDLWPMELGDNGVQVVITGVTGETSVQMTTHPLWRSLL